MALRRSIGVHHICRTWLTDIVWFSVLCLGLSTTALHSSLLANLDDESARPTRVSYSHEICRFDEQRPEVVAFLKALESERISARYIHSVGHVWLSVSESDWREAIKIAESVDCSVLPAEGPVAALPPYPEVIRPFFLRGDWVAFREQLILMQDPSKLKADSANSRALEECQFHIQVQREGLQLPTAKEWRGRAMGMGRHEAIEYLIKHVPLSRGAAISNGLVIPVSVRDIESAEIRGNRHAIGDIEDDAAIEPFSELYKLDLTRDELQPLVDALASNHTFVPAEEAASRRIRLIPTSRYCYCVLINSILGRSKSIGRANYVREYDLEDKEWKDPRRVSTLIEHAKQK